MSYPKTHSLFRYVSLSHLGLGLCLAVLAAGLVGCGMDRQKAGQEADEQVYRLIENQWQDSFGARTDYQIDRGAQSLNSTILPRVCEKGTLTLSEAVQLATWASPEFQTAREQLYLVGLDQTEAEHLYEITPFASAAAGQSMVRNTTSSSARPYENEIRGGQGTVGIQKLLATGALFTTDLTLGSFDVVSGSYRTGGASLFQAAITQPLLRGADRKVVLETLTQAQRNTLYQIRSFNRFRKTFTVSVVSDYYRLMEYALRVRYARDNIQQLKQLYQKMQHLSQFGFVAQHELEETRQDILKAEDNFAQTQRLYREMLDLFKLRLLIPPDVDIEPDAAEWQALEDFGQCEIMMTEQQAIDAAQCQRLDLANMSDQVEDAYRHIEVAADALKMDLSVVGLASPASRGRMTFGADPGDLQRTQDRYELSLRADFAMDRLLERNNYKRALIALSQQQRAHLQLTDQVIAEVRKAWRDMEEAHDRSVLQVNAKKLAQQRLDTTLLLMQHGRANTRDVLRAQEDYYSAQEGYVTAMADFAVAKMNFLRDTEMLWIHPNGEYTVQTASAAK